MSVLMRGECKAEAQTRASQGSAGIARFGHVPATRGRAAANSGTTGPTLPYEAGSIRSAVPRTVRTPLLSKYARSVSVCVRRPPRASAPFSRYATASGASPLLRGPGQTEPIANCKRARAAVPLCVYTRRCTPTIHRNSAVLITPYNKLRSRSLTWCSLIFNHGNHDQCPLR